jgi:hypothetical protein
MDADEILARIAAVARADVRKLFDDSGKRIPIVDLDDDIARAIQFVEVVRSGKGEQIGKLPIDDSTTFSGLTMLRNGASQRRGFAFQQWGRFPSHRLHCLKVVTVMADIPKWSG